MTNSLRRVIALEVRSLSLGFAVFEEPGNLLDWGVRSFRHGVNSVRIPMCDKVAGLLKEFTPDTVVVNVPIAKGRVTSVAEIKKLVTVQRIRFEVLPRSRIRSVLLVGSRNKHAVAMAIAERYPELASRLPQKRKVWQSEHYQMKIFDAAALGLTYLAREPTSQPGGVLSPASH